MKIWCSFRMLPFESFLGSSICWILFPLLKPNKFFTNVPSSNLTREVMVDFLDPVEDLARAPPCLLIHDLPRVVLKIPLTRRALKQGNQLTYLCHRQERMVSIVLSTNEILLEELRTGRFKCRVCGGKGHNLRTCPKSKPMVTKGISTRYYQCGKCGESGHNSRTC